MFLNGSHSGLVITAAEIVWQLPAKLFNDYKNPFYMLIKLFEFWPSERREKNRKHVCSWIIFWTSRAVEWSECAFVSWLGAGSDIT